MSRPRHSAARSTWRRSRCGCRRAGPHVGLSGKPERDVEALRTLERLACERYVSPSIHDDGVRGRQS